MTSATILAHLANREVTPMGILRTFSHARTWTTLWQAIGASKGEPIEIERVGVVLD